MKSILLPIPLPIEIVEAAFPTNTLIKMRMNVTPGKTHTHTDLGRKRHMPTRRWAENDFFLGSQNLPPVPVP
jgi:hypothetical protein